MKMSIKLLLVLAAVISVAQLANSAEPTDYPNIPNTPQYECLLKAKEVFLDIIAKFEVTFSNVSGAAVNLLGNLTGDIARSMKRTSIVIMNVLYYAISTGTISATTIADTVVTIIMQGFKRQTVELDEAVANILGYLGASGATIQVDLVTTISYLESLHADVTAAINSAPPLSVEKLICCLPELLQAIQTSSFAADFLKAITIVVSIAEEITSGTAVSSTSITQLEVTVSELPTAVQDLINVFIEYIHCGAI